jgi:hypothetical protein
MIFAENGVIDLATRGAYGTGAVIACYEMIDLVRVAQALHGKDQGQKQGAHSHF